MIIDPDEEPEFELPPPYVLCALVLALLLAVVMTACTSAAISQRVPVDHYGWSAPHMAPVDHDQPDALGRTWA